MMTTFEVRWKIIHKQYAHEWFCIWSEGRRETLVIMTVGQSTEKKEIWDYFKVILRSMESGGRKDSHQEGGDE